jgi:uncharacterized Zn finger protein (UPF0148 family)
MFKDTVRTLRRLARGQNFSLRMPVDADGYFDRECPWSECRFQFKVHGDDWADKVRDKEVFCPFCGKTADADQWWTDQQVKYAEERAFAHVQRRLDSALRQDAKRWNRWQPRNGIFNMTMKVDGRPRHVRLPRAVAEPMRLKIACPECGCRYAVIGAAFFCPACGHNAAELTFVQSLSGIRDALDAIDNIRSAIADRDAAETTIRQFVENGLQNAVTAFQRYAEALYLRRSSAPAPRRNAFQNLAEGSDLWRAAFGKPYDAFLDAPELAALNRAFQQRHLLERRPS